MGIGLYLFYTENMAIAYFFFGLCFAVSVLAVINPNALQVPNKCWMMLGLRMGRIVNPVVVGIMFLTLFVPLGLFLKVIQRDELRLKLHPKKSNWAPASDPHPNFKHQF